MKITTTIITLLIPFFLFGQDCAFFPIDTLNVCGYEYTLDFSLEEGTISHDCENDQYLSITYSPAETILAFSSCGTYELIYNATDGSCVDTLLIQVSDPNSSIITKNIDIGLGYGDIDCPGGVTAGCYDSGVSIPLGSGTPTPVWSFCTTTTCQTSIYTSDTIGNVIGCLADSINLETFSTYSSSDYCSDTSQNAFIVLNSEGDTVTDNTFLDYLAQLQDTTNIDCSFSGLECSFTNTSTCYDSIVIDTTLLPIPVRIGGQWTMPMIDTLQLYDTTYFEYFGRDYELILEPGVDFYGPGDLNVDLNEIFISNSNDTTRQYPSDFYLTLQWEEEWILDTILIIKEEYFDTDDDCFACGGFASGGGFNVPEIPEFPCGPVSIYYPSICDCEYEEPNYSLQLINCNPRTWQFDIISPNHSISYIDGNPSSSQSTALLTTYHNQYVEIETYDYNGCSYYISIFLEEYLWAYDIHSSSDLSCETPSIAITAHGYSFGEDLESYSFDVSETVWSNGQTGSSIIVSNEGSYSATFTDNQGCVYTASTYVSYDHSIECDEENPLADTECDMEEFDIICDIMTFESFNYVMPSQESGGNQPPILCEGGTPHNISWFSFVAYSGDYSLNVLSSGCYGSSNGQEGIQVGLYSDCSFSNSAFCSSECNVDNVAVPSQDLVEGQVYHMYIDGCSGSVCNYEMEIEGDPEPPSLAPESMTLSVNGEYIQNANTGVAHEYCLGTDVRSHLDGVEIYGEYFWSVNTIEGHPYSGETSTMTEDNDLWLTFDTEGTYEVCIGEIRNGCDLFTWTGQMCYTIKINHTEDENFGIHYVCEGDQSSFDTSILNDIDPNEDGTPGLQASLQTFQAGINTIMALDVNGCEYEQEFELELVRFPEDLVIPSSCEGQGLTLDFTAYYNDIIDDESLTIDIIDPNGQFVSTGLNQDFYTVPHGSVDGVYTILFSKSNDDITCEVSKEITLNFTALEPSTPQITNGPMALCATEGAVTYIATNSDLDVDFVWSVDGDISNFTISGDHNQNISIDWKDSGGSLSVSAVNDCGLEKSTSNDITVYISPELIITNEEETCSNSETVILLEVDEDLIDSYIWDFDDATVASGTGLGTHSLTWNTNGTKEITLTIIDIFGCDQIIESEIMVNEAPVAEFSVASDSVCISEPLIIDITNSVEGTTRDWNFEGGTNVGTDFPILLFDSPGWKTISLSTDNGACTSDKVSLSIYVESKMEEVEIMCMEQSLHSLILEWNEVDGAEGYNIKIGNQPSVIVTSNTFTADLLEENTEYNIEISVITDHRCPPPVALSSCTTQECLSLEFTFDIPDFICIENDMDIIELKSSVSGVEEGFSWSGDNITGTMFDPNGLAAGVYQMEITHQKEDCINSEIVKITLVAPPEFDLIYDDKVCYGEEFTSLGLSISENEYTVLIDGEVSDIDSEITPGSHEIVVMNNNMCASYKTIFIEESEETIITVDGDIDIKEGEENTYAIDQALNSDLDFSTLIWSINGIEYCAGIECLSINPNLKIDSEIELTALNNDGCEVSVIVRVLVEELEPKLVIPNIFSPNNDGVNDYWFAIPNKDDIKIESIKILDRWNNLVYSQYDGSQNNQMKWDGKMNGADLQPGVYVYAISYSADNTTKTIYGDVTIVK